MASGLLSPTHQVGLQPMKLSTKSEYALLALMDLAGKQSKGRVSAGDIAERQNIPYKYLERLLLKLGKAGLLKSYRGTAGGCQLARPASTITVAEVVRLMDGPLAPTRSASVHFYQKTPIAGNAALLQLFKEVREMVSAKLENTTLESLIVPTKQENCKE
jgi:Rrf2 family protein